MGRFGRYLVALAFMIPLLGTGCAEHRQVYAWGPGESGYYVEWEHETHREHLDYDRRDRDAQRDYWRWRHHHHEHDHDRDHD